MADDERISFEVQLALLDRGDDHLRLSLAENHGLCEEAQERIFHEGDLNCRESLAFNHAVVPRIQLLLAGLNEPRVDCALADNFHVTPEVQEILVSRPEMGDADYSLVSNEQACPKVLGLLWDKMSENGDYLGELVQHPSLPADLMAEAAGGHVHLRREVASNPALSLGQQMVLASDGDTSVRKNLADNKNLRPEVQTILLGDPERLVRHRIVARRNLTSEIQILVSMSFDPLEHALMFQNSTPQCTPEFGARYVKRYDSALYKEHVTDAEAADALLEGWKGSLADLVEAVKLTQR